MQSGASRVALMNPGDATLAGKAAEEVAAYESQFTAIKVHLDSIEGDVAWVGWTPPLLVGGVAFLVVKTSH